MPPRTPIDVTITDITATSANISWTIPEILYDEEMYYVQYGLQNTTLDQTSSIISSGPVMDITNAMYTVTLQNLHPYYTYYFVVTAMNSIAPKSTEVFWFTTLEAGKIDSHHDTCMCYVYSFFSTKWSSTELYIGSD